MLTAKRLIGLPVVTLADGREIGRVKHVLLDTEHSRVVGLAVDVGRWWRGCPVVPVERTVGMGERAVTVPSCDALSPVETDPALERIAESERPLIGQLVLSRDGTSLGTVADYAFDLHDGRITSLEVAPSGSGEETLPALVRAEQILVFGRDAVVVGGRSRPEAERGERAPAHGGGPAPLTAAAGAQPAAAAGRDDVGEAAETAAGPAETRGPMSVEEPPGSSASGGGPAGLGPTSAGGPAPFRGIGGALPAADLARLFQERQERFLLGKTAQRPVRDDQGGVIVAAGEVVTKELLVRVKEAGRLLDLTASVSLRA